MDHGDHGHDHHHGHGHEHAHGDADYFLEQLLTILVCGAFGVVAILMYQFNMLNHILVPQFHLWVMIGGVVLLVFTAIRGIAIWTEAGAHRHAHAHDHHHHHGHDHTHGEHCHHGHDHGPGCEHDHSHEHHHDQAALPRSKDHDHSHEHGSIFWRVVVLAFPILLFCLGLPNEGFSKDWIERRLGKDVALENVAAVQEKGGDVIEFDFAELNATAYDPGKRASYEGRTVRVKGQLRAVGQREYTLFKLKMACCAADMIPLKARIKTESVMTFNDYDWVSVQGVLQFVEVPGQGQFIPVVRVKSAKDMQKTAPEA